MRALLLAAALALGACDGANEERDGAETPAATPPRLPGVPEAVSAQELAALDSDDCAVVAGLYLEAIGRGDFALAARAWDDPVIDDARLEALFRAYEQPSIEWSYPSIEDAAGSLDCTVTGTLTDAGDPAKPASEGRLLLRPVNAATEELRWRLRSSTFVEPLERSGTGEP